MNAPTRIRPAVPDPLPFPTTSELLRARARAIVAGDWRRAFAYGAALEKRLSAAQRSGGADS